MSDGLFIGGAFETAFSVEDREQESSTPGVASFELVFVSPTISGGIEAVRPGVATFALTTVSPAIPAGIEAVIPAVATFTLTAISPTTLPSVQVRAAVKGVFGFSPKVVADEWGASPKVVGEFFGNE